MPTCPSCGTEGEWATEDEFYDYDEPDPSPAPTTYRPCRTIEGQISPRGEMLREIESRWETTYAPRGYKLNDAVFKFYKRSQLDMLADHMLREVLQKWFPAAA